MMILVLFTLLGTALCIPPGKFIFDLLKSPLTAEEVNLLTNNRDAAPFPTLAEVPENLKFSCADQKHPGFYADVTTQCQVFHRCDISGNMTNYLCANTTVFNQLTLICEYWYNVDCERSGEFVEFANSRLYTAQQLFDSPPIDYISPYQEAAASRMARQGEFMSEVVEATTRKSNRTTKRKTAKRTTTASTTSSPEDS